MAGCAVGPDYERPDVRLPGQWSLAASTRPAGAATRPAAAAPPVDLTEWWQALGDPRLDELIRRASESNLDLRIATARVAEARALRDVAVADFWPQVNLNGSYAYRGSSRNASRQRSASLNWRSQLARSAAAGASNAIGNQVNNLLNPGGTGGTGGTGAGGLGSGGGSGLAGGSTGQAIRDVHLFQAGFDASWELDVFGRIRRSVEAADADVQASEEDRRAVLVTLLADVALNYVQLRGYQQRLAVAERNIIDQQATVDVTEDRHRAGFSPELEVHQARALLETTQSQVPLLSSAIRQSIYQLGVLLGEPPEALLEELLADAPIPTAPPEVPMGLPSDLLRRRPDVRAAERALAAATARIGVATADLFPTFSLTGNVGPATSNIKHFLDENSLAWSVGPGVSWPVFQGGRIQANIRAQNARQEQALAAYARAVLTALQEVENALVAYNNEKVRYETLARAVHANQEAVAIATLREEKGVVNFLSVIDSLRSLYSTQDQLIQSQTTTLTNLIALYKALGGGWEPPEDMRTENSDR